MKQLDKEKKKNLLPKDGEGLDEKEYQNALFEWSYPELASSYKKSGRKYPKLNNNGEFDSVTIK